LPPGVSQADVAIYDSIFGQFNPMRQPAETHAVADQTAAKQGAGDSTATEQQSPDQQSTNLMTAGADLSVRLQIATRQRRAGVSQMRDQAIQTGQAELMQQADLIESRLDAFAKAQAEMAAAAQTRAGATVHTTSRFGGQASGQAKVRAQGQANGVTQAGQNAGTQARAKGNAVAQTAAQEAAGLRAKAAHRQQLLASKRHKTPQRRRV
jgi:hypothetical protein